MTSATNSGTDADLDLQREVEQELSWDPSVTPASIGVSAHHHAITLSGTVGLYSDRLAAVRAAKRVRGVQTIADDIVVEPSGSTARTDHDIAEHIEHALRWSSFTPGTIKATVRDGVVTLDGTTEFNYQRTAF